MVWSHDGRFNGQGAIQDGANPAQLNRLDWYSAHGWKTPYPGDKTILPPSQVPGHNLPADYLGDCARLIPRDPHLRLAGLASQAEAYPGRSGT